MSQTLGAFDRKKKAVQEQRGSSKDGGDAKVRVKMMVEKKKPSRGVEGFGKFLVGNNSAFR